MTSSSCSSVIIKCISLPSLILFLYLNHLTSLFVGRNHCKSSPNPWCRFCSYFSCSATKHLLRSKNSKSFLTSYVATHDGPGCNYLKTISFFLNIKKEIAEWQRKWYEVLSSSRLSAAVCSSRERLFHQTLVLHQASTEASLADCRPVKFLFPRRCVRNVLWQQEKLDAFLQEEKGRVWWWWTLFKPPPLSFNSASFFFFLLSTLFFSVLFFSSPSSFIFFFSFFFHFHRVLISEHH